MLLPLQQQLLLFFTSLTLPPISDCPYCCHWFCEGMKHITCEYEYVQAVFHDMLWEV